jgi:hypothetical protein
MTGRLDWLHGWPRMGEAGGGTAVLLGNAVHCVGCGRFQGITTVAIDEDWQDPGPTPTWPFPEGECPVCDIDRPTRPESEAAEIVRALAAEGSVRDLVDLRRRARAWRARTW